MKPEIHARFTPAMLADLSTRYGVSPADLTTLDGFESFIYRFGPQGRGTILRVGHSGRRGEALVRGEMDWLKYLAAGGASVAAPVPSTAGNPVEQVPDGQGEQFVAAAFEEAPGVLPNQFGWTETVYEDYGRALGRMHALTTNYLPSDPLAFRPRWDHPAINDVAANLVDLDPVILEKWNALVAQCRTLPTPPDAFGLIHFDAHGLNFFVAENGALTFFDFDDCNYNWFAADIAIVLFYKVMWAEDMPAATRAFLDPFLRGYRQEFNLDPAWLETIPLFLKMREIDLYALIHRDFDLATEDDPWIVGYMRGRRERIHADVPYIDLDFAVFSDLSDLDS